MKSVQHLSNYGSYAKGVVSNWPDNIADDLVKRGLCKPVMVAPNDTPPAREGIAQKMIRKVARPSKKKE